jgi:aspartate aminotransferase
LQQQTGIQYRVEDILISSGGSAAICAAMIATLNPGDQMLLPQPTYSLYADVARLIGVEVTHVALTPDYHLDIDALRTAATPRARMLVLNSPCNPTGVCFTSAELAEVAQLVEELNLIVLSDEVYDHLIYDGHPHVSPLHIPGLSERTLYVNTFSKTYAMTGCRLGYFAARGAIAPAVQSVHAVTVGYVNSAVQRAGLAALNGPLDWLATMLSEYTARRALVAEWIERTPDISWQQPVGAFYGLLRYAHPLPAAQVTAWLHEWGVGVRSGTEFGPGGESHIRISFAVSRTMLAEGLGLIGQALAELPT